MYIRTGGFFTSYICLPVNVDLYNIRLHPYKYVYSRLSALLPEYCIYSQYVIRTCEYGACLLIYRLMMSSSLKSRMPTTSVSPADSSTNSCIYTYPPPSQSATLAHPLTPAVIICLQLTPTCCLHLLYLSTLLLVMNYAIMHVLRVFASCFL